MKFIAFLPGVLLAAPLAAQDRAETAPTSLPDPATIETPWISGGRDSRVVRNGWKYFYFWRADTSFEEAYADFSDCYRFLPAIGGIASLPAFAVWHRAEDIIEPEPQYTNQYGLVGVALAALVAGPQARRASQSRMRRCMEPRGYQRYPAPEETWEQIIDNYSVESIAVQAKITSGPRPDADPLPDTR